MYFVKFEKLLDLPFALINYHMFPAIENLQSFSGAIGFYIGTGALFVNLFHKMPYHLR